MSRLRRVFTASASAAALIVAMAYAAPGNASALCIEGCHPPPPPPPASPPPPPPSISITGTEGVWTIGTHYGGTDSIFSGNLLGNPEMTNSSGDPLVPVATFTASGKAGSQLTVNALDQLACQIPPGVNDGGAIALVQASHSATGSGSATVTFQPNLKCPFDWLALSSTQTAAATQGNYTTPVVSFQYTFSY